MVNGGRNMELFLLDAGKTFTTTWSYNVEIPQPPVKVAGENFEIISTPEIWR